MSLTLTPTSTQAVAYSDIPSGHTIQMAYGQNTTNGTKVFSAWNTFEAVPGGLECTITPKAVGNIMLIQAHLFWGGSNYQSNDCAANFRIYKSTNGGSTYTSAGTYYTDAGLGQQATIGVATGTYFYNWGDSNASALEDHILMYDTISSTNSTIYAVWWACGYAPSSRTLYWNRTVNTGNSYNPTHVCSITVKEIKA